MGNITFRHLLAGASAVDGNFFFIGTARKQIQLEHYVSSTAVPETTLLSLAIALITISGVFIIG